MTTEKYKEEWFSFVNNFNKQFNDNDSSQVIACVSDLLYQVPELNKGLLDQKENLLSIISNIYNNFKAISKIETLELKPIIKELRYNVLINNNSSIFFCIKQIYEVFLNYILKSLYLKDENLRQHLSCILKVKGKIELEDKLRLLEKYSISSNYRIFIMLSRIMQIIEYRYLYNLNNFEEINLSITSNQSEDYNKIIKNRIIKLIREVIDIYRRIENELPAEERNILVYFYNDFCNLIKLHENKNISDNTFCEFMTCDSVFNNSSKIVNAFILFIGRRNLELNGI
ncbi:MAG: hypothetical protein V1824_00820 [archaeon]